MGELTMARSSGTGPIVLTGATGFVGRRLQQALLAAGHSVRALVRTGSRNAAHIQAGCEAVAVDLEDRAALTAVLSDAAAVIYCAGSVRGRLPGGRDHRGPLHGPADQRGDRGHSVGRAGGR